MSQAYTVNLVDENVLRGNAVVMKCLIPSFVTEYVAVSSWIISEGTDKTEIRIDNAVSNYGILYTIQNRTEILLLPIPYLGFRFSCRIHCSLVLSSFTLYFSGVASVHREYNGRKRSSWECRGPQMSYFNFRY